MKNPTGSQKAALIKAGKQGPVVVIRKVTAHALISAGYLVRASGFTATGVRCSLTAKGRRWFAE